MEVLFICLNGNIQTQLEVLLQGGGGGKVEIGSSLAVFIVF